MSTVVLPPVFLESLNFDPEPFFRRYAKICPPAHRDGPAVFPDGPDDLHEMLQVLIGPLVPVIDQRGFLISYGRLLSLSVSVMPTGRKKYAEDQIGGGEYVKRPGQPQS
jgi:hypothetical protein